MAIYRMSDMIRMRRQALGMTQHKLIEIPEEAVEGMGDNVICSTDTLRRMEQGRLTKVKNRTFKKLMWGLSSLPERDYASICVTNAKALRLKSDIHVHICLDEYQEAEKKLERLEAEMVPDYPRNQQYRMEKRAVLAYKQGKLEAGKYLEILWDALRLTVPVLGQVDLAGWPFNRVEFNILSDIGNVYSDLDNMDQEYEFLMMLKENVERKYMDNAHYVVWHMRVLSGLSQWMCIAQRYGEALDYCKVGIEECKEGYILGQVYHFLYDTAWSREEQRKQSDWMPEKSGKEREDFIKKERAFCKKQLVQAYYLSVAQGHLYEAERVKRLYENLYPEEVKLP